MAQQPHKNIGPFLAFTEAWFARHQNVLLWLLNAPLLKKWFRWVLRIHNDCPPDERIVDIGPNRFTFGERFFLKDGKWNVERKIDFRTHPKFGKRLYYAFRPFWWLVHFWDWAFADRFVPRLSYGFSTLTVYPDAATGATTVDGYLQNNNHPSTFSVLRSRTLDGTDVIDTSSTNLYVYLGATATTNQFNYLIRTIMTFDTSSLTSSATISAVTLSLFGKSKATGMTDSSNITSSTPAANNNLALGDYNQLGTTKFATDLTMASFSTTAYNTFTLNSSGISNISKTSVSKFGWQLTSDITNTQPTWVSGQTVNASAASADTTGTTNDPKLVITYTVGTTYTQTLSETLTLTDVFTKAITKPFSETLTLTDTFVKSIARAFTETLSLTDIFAGVKTKVLTLLETITLSDTLSRSVGKVLSETLTVTDTLTKTISRAFTETVNLTASLVKATQKTLTETLTLTDTLATVKSYVRVLTETITLSDTFTRVASLYRTFTETLSLTDTFSKAVRKVFSEVVSLTDSFLKSVSKVFTETLSLTDSFIRGLNYFRTFTETLSLSDTFTSVKTLLRTFTETITLSDTFTRTVNYLRTFTETIVLSDTLRNLLNGVATIWTNRIKPLLTWSNRQPPGGHWHYDELGFTYDDSQLLYNYYSAPTSFTNRTKPTTGWTNRTKPSPTTFTNRIKSITNWTNRNKP